MFLLLAAALQIVPVQRPETIALTISQPCAGKTGEEVVVCAKRGDSPYRLRDVPPARRQALPAAQVKIADGVSAGAETESADVGGFASNRMMVRSSSSFEPN